MAKAFYVVSSILILIMYVYGKENATEETTKSKYLSPGLVDLEVKNFTSTQQNISKNKENINIHNNEEVQGQRHKRGYYLNGFYPPLYPTYAPKNDPSVKGANDHEELLEQIHNKISDIAAILRQTAMPSVPPASNYPILLPFLYPPSSNCGCAPNDNKRPPPPNPTQPIVPSTNITDTPSRVLEVEGGVSGSFIEDDEDFSRPISFIPIPPAEGINRRPPPVEHGSVQEETISVGLANTSPLTNSDTTRNIPSFSTPGLPTPNLQTLCDIAIISCCHQVSTTDDCFATQGCPNLLLYGNPCNSAVMLKAIERLQSFYAQKNNNT